MKRLENKTALVTGGSRGIGAAIVKRLAAEGADVAFTYYNSGAETYREVLDAAAAAGRKAIAIRADSADPAAVAAAVAQTVTTLGGIDILVNNAAVAVLKPIDDFNLEDFDATVAVNIRAVFVAIHAAQKHMKEGGRIITIGSCMADRIVLPGGSLYGMSKSALVGMVRGIARDLGPRRITCNLVQPGPVDTDMNPADSDFADTLRSYMAIPEYSTAGHVAGLVAYLAAEEARHVTGAMLTIDGGFNA